MACSKQAIIDNETQTTISLPIENNDLKIQKIFSDNTNCIGQIRLLKFANESNGVCITNGDIYITKNKGINWRSSYNSPHIDTTVNITDLEIIDKQSIIAIGFKKIKFEKEINIIIKSTDWGDTWQTIYESAESNMMTLTADNDNNLYSLNYISDPNSTIKTAVLKSTDLGKSWQSLSNLNLGIIYGFKFLSKTHLFISSSTGRFISIDGGKTWIEDFSTKAFPSNALDYSFHKGFGYSQTNYNADILKVDETGNTWSKTYNTSTFLNSIKVVSGKAIFAFGSVSTYNPNQQNEARIIYSIDEGINWKELQFIKNKYAFIAFYDEKNGYILCEHEGYKGFYKVTLK